VVIRVKVSVEHRQRGGHWFGICGSQVVDVRRDREQIRRRHGHELGESPVPVDPEHRSTRTVDRVVGTDCASAAAEHRVHGHPVAGLHPLHQRADGVDRPGELMPEDQRGCGRQLTRGDQEVGPAEPGDAHMNPDVVGKRQLRDRNPTEPDPSPVPHNRLHHGHPNALRVC
jgi:hypothetical protein